MGRKGRNLREQLPRGGAFVVSNSVECTAWQALHQRLLNSLPREAYELWFRNLSLVEWTSSCLRVSAPNPYAKQWVERHYRREMLECAAAVAPGTRGVELLVARAAQANAGPAAVGSLLPSQPALEKGGVAGSARTAPGASASHNGPIFTMDSFVVGPSNQLAYAACCSVLDAPGTSYNPLVLCGGRGVGKTHLLQGLGRAFQARHPDLCLRAASAEEFANAYLYAMRDRKLEGFRQLYRRSDVLLMDEFQFLAGKVKTQDEFFHTFESLFHLGRQIVVACNQPPWEIPNLDVRLAERMQSGLLARLHPPSQELRVELILAKARRRGLDLGRDAAELLAAHTERSVRELEGAVCKLDALSEAQARRPDREMVLLALKELGYLRDGPPTLEEILATVAARFRHSPDQIRSGKRHISLVRSRHVLMYLARELTTHSLAEIGQFTGNRDHSTVLHAVQKVEAALTEDEALRTDLQALRRTLGR